MHAVNVKEEEQMPLQKETKTTKIECSNIAIGDILVSQVLGDTVKVVAIDPGDFYTKLTFGGPGTAKTITVEYENRAKLIKVECNTLS